uniref:Uncharacterized protein n=1 Tax=Mucochytrium quahogii TaxID=96639 RepID=A0A7S2RV50_9STRA
MAGHDVAGRDPRLLWKFKEWARWIVCENVHEAAQGIHWASVESRDFKDLHELPIEEIKDGLKRRLAEPCSKHPVFNHVENVLRFDVFGSALVKAKLVRGLEGDPITSWKQVVIEDRPRRRGKVADYTREKWVARFTGFEDKWIVTTGRSQFAKLLAKITNLKQNTWSNKIKAMQNAGRFGVIRFGVIDFKLDCPFLESIEVYQAEEIQAFESAIRERNYANEMPPEWQKALWLKFKTVIPKSRKTLDSDPGRSDKASESEGVDADSLKSVQNQQHETKKRLTMKATPSTKAGDCFKAGQLESKTGGTSNDGGVENKPPAKIKREPNGRGVKRKQNQTVEQAFFGVHNTKQVATKEKQIKQSPRVQNSTRPELSQKISQRENHQTIKEKRPIANDLSDDEHNGSSDMEKNHY